MNHVVEYIVLELISLGDFPLKETSEQELILPWNDRCMVLPYLECFDKC